VHQALLDPTGQYMLFPDLGADLVHVYCIDSANNNLTAHKPLKSTAGYGPRHATFWTNEDESAVYLFVVHELSNKIVSYVVTYLEEGGLEFTQVDEVSTFGDKETPKGAAASEIVVVSYPPSFSISLFSFPFWFCCIEGHC
jgi:6-phosphogluconolactonase (cycloisomerase 2 family)